MKIGPHDLRKIESMVAAGASGAVVLAFLHELDAEQAPKRAKDKDRKADGRKRKRADNRGTTGGQPPDSVSREATLGDTPRARLFREGTAALISMGRTERAARQLIATWLKLTHDDAQLVLATILRGQELAVADAAGWILATLKGKTDGNRIGKGGGKSSGADFFAGLADVAKDIAGDGGVAGDTAEEVPLGRFNIDG